MHNPTVCDIKTDKKETVIQEAKVLMTSGPFQTLKTSNPQC